MKKFLMLILVIFQLCMIGGYAEGIGAENTVTEIGAEEVKTEEETGIESLVADNEKFIGAVPEDGAVNINVADAEITLSFDGAVDESSLSAAVFELNGSTELIESAALDKNGDVKLELAELKEGTKYTLTFNGILCNGVETSGQTSFITGFTIVNTVQVFEKETIASYYGGRHLGATSVSTEENKITVTTDKSCSIYSSELNIDPTDVKVISFTIKSEKDFTAELYFSDRQISGYSNEKKYEFAVKAGVANTCVLLMHEIDAWNQMSVIKGLRLTQADTVSNIYEISRVAFTDGVPTFDGGNGIKIGNLSLKSGYGSDSETDITNGTLVEGSVSAVIDAVYNPLEESKRILFLIAYYEDDAMTDIKGTWINIEAGETKYDLEVSVDAPSWRGSVKAFVRNGLSDITSLKTGIAVE